jgi:hypothetical protein
MGIGDKVLEALRTGVLLNERVTMLTDKVERIDQDVRRINDRLIRLETMVELAQGRQRKIE